MNKIVRTHTIVVFGAASSGKTALIKRYLYDTFEEQNNPTIQDYYNHLIDFHGTLINLLIIDMAGSYQFPAMRRQAIQQGDSFMLVYTSNNPKSIKETLMYREEIQQIKDTGQVPVIYVCNKIDQLCENQKAIMKKLQWELLINDSILAGTANASAKENLNVDCLFTGLLDLSGFNSRFEDVASSLTRLPKSTFNLIRFLRKVLRRRRRSNT